MANQEAIRKWYLALKSEEYRQTKGRLKTGNPDDGGPDQYCCWGVACDLFPDDGWSWKQGYSSQFNATIPFLSAERTCFTAIPPDEVCQWLGIDESTMLSIPHEIYDSVLSHMTYNRGLGSDVTGTLIEFNDTGVPFDLIADIIWHNYGEGDPPDA